ncbi:winged helix DNA-binding domain-containing protein [Actinoplanes solisilvae]|uniref:winged helix DNA-binding domain-containing protein n=1 Tax=Actinoplanes solisilvae TaxID=2486853 RepID=UPI000FD7B2D4|nr:winged helix DNA-binding domain-containing protein [Actinoplanes solisilvae]
MTVLDNRALNRALLARQLLDRRRVMPALDAVEHLVGLQGQEPHEPYVGLWSRLDGFRPPELAELLENRRVVRTLLMRRTIHLVSAADCLALRSLHQPMLEARTYAVLRRRLEGVDLAELRAAGQPHFEREPRTLPDVGRAVGARWPDVAPRDLGDALSSLVPLVQVPPRGVWGVKAPARNTTIEAWLGSPVSPASSADDLVLRYLRAFGPASSSDIRAWSGLSGLRESIQRLRPRLRSFRDVRGRELLDVLDAPLPDPATPAPPRFLPAFDNVVLGFDDRTRVIDNAHRGLSVAGARFLLVDGRVAGTWTITPDALRVTMLTSQPASELDAVAAEGEDLLAWHGIQGRIVIDAG